MLLDAGNPFLVQVQLYNGLGLPVRVGVYSFTVTISLLPQPGPADASPANASSSTARAWDDSTIAVVDPGPSALRGLEATVLNGVASWDRLRVLGWPGRYQLRFSVSGVDAADFPVSSS